MCTETPRDIAWLVPLESFGQAGQRESWITMDPRFALSHVTMYQAVKDRCEVRWKGGRGGIDRCFLDLWGGPLNKSKMETTSNAQQTCVTWYEVSSPCCRFWSWPLSRPSWKITSNPSAFKDFAFFFYHQMLGFTGTVTGTVIGTVSGTVPGLGSSSIQFQGRTGRIHLKPPKLGWDVTNDNGYGLGDNLQWLLNVAFTLVQDEKCNTGVRWDSLWEVPIWALVVGQWMSVIWDYWDWTRWFDGDYWRLLETI